MLRSAIGRLRITGYLEGVSYLGLLGIAVPLKHCYGMPEATEVIGMVHGILFIFYVLFLMEVRSTYRWDIKTTLLAFIAALLPFGTFVADVKIFKACDGQ